MDTTLIRGAEPLALLAISVAFMLALLASPLFRSYPDDQGDGMALVLLPAPKVPRAWRAPALALLFAAMTALQEGVIGPMSPNTLYAEAVNRLASTAVSAPTELNGYLSHFELGLRFLVVGTMISLGVLARGTPARRLILLGQAVWYIATMLVIDALLLVIEAVLGVASGPGTLIGNFIAIAVGFLAMARMLFVNFALPKPTAVPFAPRPRWSDALTLVAVTLTSMALSLAVLLVLYQRADPHLKAALAVFAPIPFSYAALVGRSVLLGVIGFLTAAPEQPVTDERPPIEVIIPAYNEAEVIADTLKAIDAAAARYGGPVHVVLANDGSKDDTRVIAQATITGFQAATGEVIDVHHGGKSATLNAALAHTSSDLVVRIDADTLIGEWSLYYAHRWFRDPEIGLVEAMMLPRWRRSPFPRMRLFEELKQFGFVHRTIQQVDGVNVVPGVFTMFRRDPALRLGGFTMGMNGEDGDFTLRMSRLGYRLKMDPKVVVREDVPPTYWEIREQRIRWDRATIHNDARHGPYRAGLATPKVWFSHMHQFFARMFAPIRLTLPVFLLLTAAFQGIYRVPVLLFTGAWLFASITFVALESFLAIAYRQERRIGWLLLWPLWQICCTLFSTEAWLSLPPRPVVLHGPKAVAITEAVIH
jgi:cellulose synthase/poly-beta-1,6-N-acetylglucosamine synthase-like glycosyltransferase